MVEKRHLIVGIDPGTTTGIALLGLDGKVWGIYSSRTFTIKDVIHLIIGHGSPLIVATDVSPVPAFVEKVCRLFEAVLHQPTRSLTAQEKREIATSFSSKFSTNLFFRNSHEKDAFAAAAKALESYDEKFRWIDRKLNERGLTNISEQVKSLVVSGKSLSDSVRQVLGEKRGLPPRKFELPAVRAAKTQPPKPKVRGTEQAEASLIKSMRKEILQLRTMLKERELKIKSLGNELERVRSSTFWEIVKSNEINTRNRMILELKRSLSSVAADRDRLRRKLDTLPGSGIWKVWERIEAMPILEDLSRETVGRMSAQLASRSIRFVLVKNATGAGASVSKMLSEMKVQAVIADGGMPAQAVQGLESRGIPVITRSKVELLALGDTALADRESLEKVLSRERSRVAKLAVDRAMSGLERLVDDYRKGLASEGGRGQQV